MHGVDLTGPVGPGAPFEAEVVPTQTGCVRGRTARVGRAAVPAARSVSRPGPDAVVLAHGIGERQDLPLPLSFVVIGAAAALVVSFWALAALWRRPVLGRIDHGRPLPPGLARALTSPGGRA